MILPNANKIDNVDLSDIKFGDNEKEYKANNERSCVKCPAKTNSGDTSAPRSLAIYMLMQEDM